MSRATLKPIVSKLREAIIKGVAGKLEKCGFDETGALSIEKPLSAYDETIRDNLIALFEAKQINNQGKYVDYIHNTSRTFMHILICFKLMEKRGIMETLLERVIQTNIYNEIIPDFVNINPMAFDEFVLKYESEIMALSSKDNNEENEEYYQFIYLIEVLSREMSHEVPLLFKEYEYNLVQPDYDDLRVIIQLIFSIEESEYTEDDFLGWIYQYWVDASKPELTLAKKEKDISSSSQIYWQILDGLDNEQSQFGEFYTPREVVKEIVQKTLLPIAEEKELEEIKLLDPACGAGNFLVCALSEFYNLYHKRRPNWSDSKIINTILKNNLFGIDIQREPLQIAAINLWILARTMIKDINLSEINLYRMNVLMANSLYRFENEPEFVQMSLFDSFEVNNETKFTSEDIGQFISSRESMMKMSAQTVFKNKFDIIVMNPPYLGIRKMKPALSQFLKSNYPQNYNNLFEAFLARALELMKKGAKCGLVGTDTFLTLESHKNIRAELVKKAILNEINKVGNVFDGPTVNAVVMIFTKEKPSSKNEVIIEDKRGKRTILQSEFLKIKDAPFTFDFNKKFFALFDKEKAFKDVAEIKQGIMTGDNQKFLRKKWQIPHNKIGVDYYPFAKGGGYSKYANDMYDYLFYANDGELIKKEAKIKYGSETRTIKNQEYFYRGGLTYSHITSNNRFSARYYPSGCIFGNAGPCIFTDSLSVEYLLGLTNSKLFNFIVLQLNPTANYEIGDIERVPIVQPSIEKYKAIEEKVIQLQSLKQYLLGFSYTSDFYHEVEIEFGLRNGAKTLKEAYDLYLNNYESIIVNMHNMQSAIDQDFYEIYGMDKFEIELIESEFSESPFQDSSPVSYEEAVVLWIRKIVKDAITESAPKIYTSSEISSLFEQKMDLIFSENGYKVVEEIEHAINVNIEALIEQGIKINNKKTYLYGISIQDEAEPFLQGRILGGKGKKKNIVIWNSSQFLIEFEEDRKYAMQNEIRRLTNEVYLAKLHRLKEQLQLYGNVKQEIEAEIEICEECIKTLENWKVVE